MAFSLWPATAPQPDALKAQQAALNQQVQAQPLIASLLYVLLYVVVTALSLPGAPC
ncbi:hypothetical protein UMZ34_00420 [Halopseudomonas pachastrellae]|nr:hypothetical protein UMZ34_00420 [Halopseudomonas pachastrellae]